MHETVVYDVIATSPEVIGEEPDHTPSYSAEDSQTSAILNNVINGKHVFSTCSDGAYVICPQNGNEIDKEEISPECIETEKHSEYQLQQRSFKSEWLSIGLAFLVSAFYSAGIIMAKFQKGVEIMQMLVFRSLGEVLLAAAAGLWNIRAIRAQSGDTCRLSCKQFWPLFLMGFLKASCYLLYYIGFTMISLGDAMAIFYCFPVIVMLLSVCVLKEHCGVYRVILAFVLLIGLILISKPSFLLTNSQDVAYGNKHLYGCFTVAVAALLYSIIPILRKKHKDISSSVIVFAMGIETLILSGGYLFIFGEPRVPTLPLDWMFCIVSVLLSVLGQFLWNYEQASHQY